MKYTLILITLLFITSTVQSQIYDPVKWSYSFKRTSKTEGVVSFKALIQPKWHIYSQRFVKEGPTRTSFSFTPSSAYKLIGKTIEPKSLSKYEAVFNASVNYFEKQVTFQQKVKLNIPKTNIKGTLEYMACSNSMCLPAEEIEFVLAVK